MPDQDQPTTAPQPGPPPDAVRLLRRLLPADAAVRRRAWDEVLGILKRGVDR